MGSNLRAMHEQVHGPPWERSVRGRLHVLESSEAATRTAEAALEAAKAMQGRTWSRRSKVLAAAIGIVTASCAVGAFVLALIAAT
jgi:hypothetical protein